MNALPYIVEVADQQQLTVDPEPLIAMIQRVLADHDIARAEISLALVDDATIRRLNRQYLQHDYETDVISFVLDWDESASALTGQLIVSTETASNMAKQVCGTFEEELLLYVVHGTLHLVGFDDQSPEDAALMRSQEREYLNRAGLVHRGFDTVVEDEPQQRGS